MTTVRIGNVKDVAPGQIRAFDVAGTKVDVANVDGQLYAFDDTCTHRGYSLARGTLDGTTLTCPSHSQFDVASGAVVRGPATQPVRSRSVQIGRGSVDRGGLKSAAYFPKTTQR